MHRDAKMAVGGRDGLEGKRNLEKMDHAVQKID